MSMYIGLDLGTSALKALLVNGRQKILAAASRRYPTVAPGPGLAEQNPTHWLDATKQAMAQLRAEAPDKYARVRAIGLSGQMHSLLVLDRAHRPLRPVILWNDVRGDDWCIHAERARPQIARITGVAPMPSFTSAKLAWLKAGEPDTFRRIAHILPPKDYLRLQLTGEIATDPSDASGTQLLDQSLRQWSGEMLDMLNLMPDWLPKILSGTEFAGRLRADLAADLVLDRIPVVTGAGDAAASAVGAGCVRNGQAMISLGTGAVYLSAQETYRPPELESVHAFSHCLPDLWFSMTTLLSCGSTLEWACRMLGGRDVTQMMDRITAASDAPGRALFLPFIDGTRTPVRDAQVRGAFFGLDGGANADTMMRAVIEGVGFALAEADAQLRLGAEVEPQPMILGAGVRSRAWCRLIATILGRPVRRAVAAESGAALGAARLAMLASGAGSVAQLCYAPDTNLIEPETANVNAYRQRFETFRAMLASTREFAGLP